MIFKVDALAMTYGRERELGDRAGTYTVPRFTLSHMYILSISLSCTASCTGPQTDTPPTEDPTTHTPSTEDPTTDHTPSTTNTPTVEPTDSGTEPNTAGTTGNSGGGSTSSEATFKGE